MTSFLLFLAACAAIVLVFWVIGRITGARAWYLDAWPFEDGERLIWRDDRSDFGFLTKLGRPATTRPFRLHRWPVVVTNRRVLVACKTITGRAMVTEVLCPRTAPGGESGKIGGGLLTRGYRTLVIHPEAEKNPEKGWVALRPVEHENASFNLRELRIYTDDVAGFRMPDDGLPGPEGAAGPSRDPEPVSP